MLPHEFVKALEEGKTVRLTNYPGQTLFKLANDGRIMEQNFYGVRTFPFGGNPSWSWLLTNAEHAVIVESGVDDDERID